MSNFLSHMCLSCGSLLWLAYLFVFARLIKDPEANISIWVLGDL